MTKRVLLGLAIAFLLSAPAQAQPLVTIGVGCASVEVVFRTSIQPDSATVEITSNAGTETHSPTLFQGGTQTVTFPLDGQNGESVSVTVTLVYRGNPSVFSATEALAGCPEPSPSPSPSPTVEPSPEPTPVASASPTIEAGVTPGPSPTPDAISESPVAEEEVESAVAETGETVPGELPRTGLDIFTGFAVSADLVLAGLLLRRRAHRLSLEAFQRESDGAAG